MFPYQQVGFYNPLKRPNVYARRRGLRGLGTVSEALASARQDLADAQTALQQDSAELAAAQQDLAAGQADDDGSAESQQFIQAAAAQVSSLQSYVAADQAAVSSAQAQIASLSDAAASAATPTSVVQTIPAATQQALLAANPNVFNAGTVGQLVQQITQAMQNSNLTSIQRQALQNQLATYQGGLFSQRNMPMLLAAAVALVFIAKR